MYLVFSIYLVLAALSALLYLPKFAQLSHAFKKPEKRTATKMRRIAIVVPARNESKVIGDLFRSIRAQNYDRNYFDVNVIVKEKFDPTVEFSKKEGANVFVVEEQSCKGDALDGYFQALSREQFESYDAFVIVDADAVLSPDYMTELNNALEGDADILVTRKNVKNFLGDRRLRTLVTDCSALVYPVVDELGNLYRAEKKVPLNLCGQGLLVRRRVIEQLGGWPYRSLTEDYELKMDSVLKGFTSAYCPHAVIYTEEVLGHRESYVRRVRWLTGYSQCDRKYKKAVRRKLKAEKAGLPAQFDFKYYLFAPVLFLIATFACALVGIGMSAHFAATGAPWRPCLRLLTGVPFATLYLLLFLYGALAMLSYRDALSALSVGEKALTLLCMPFFLLEFVPVFVQSRVKARKTAHDWIQPSRNNLGDGFPTEKL